MMPLNGRSNENDSVSFEPRAGTGAGRRPGGRRAIDPKDVTVVDGDTIVVYGMYPNVRLVGFDAPETWRPDCDAERELGLKVTARLRELVRGGKLTFQYVRWSCPESKIGTHWCNWGRDCGTLKSNGRDVGDILIEEDLTVPFICGKTRNDKADAKRFKEVDGDLYMDGKRCRKER